MVSINHTHVHDSCASMMTYGLYASSFLIDQHNETEPAEETSLELTSEDSETYAAEGHSLTSFP